MNRLTDSPGKFAFERFLAFGGRSVRLSQAVFGRSDTPTPGQVDRRRPIHTVDEDERQLVIQAGGYLLKEFCSQVLP